MNTADLSRPTSKLLAVATLVLAAAAAGSRHSPRQEDHAKTGSVTINLAAGSSKLDGTALVATLQRIAPNSRPTTHIITPRKPLTLPNKAPGWYSFTIPGIIKKRINLARTDRAALTIHLPSTDTAEGKVTTSITNPQVKPVIYYQEELQVFPLCIAKPDGHFKLPVPAKSPVNQPSRRFLVASDGSGVCSDPIPLDAFFQISAGTSRPSTLAIPAPPTEALELLICCPNGNPIPHAAITKQPRDSAWDPHQPITTISSLSGRATLSAPKDGPITVTVTTPGYCTTTTRIPPLTTPSPYTITLKPSHSVQGRLQTPNEDPIAFTDVTLYRNEEHPPLPTHSLTDQEGFFLFNNICPGDYRVGLREFSKGVLATNLRVPQRRAQPNVITVPGGVALKGVITSPAGEPRANYLVGFDGATWRNVRTHEATWVRTSATGEFHLKAQHPLAPRLLIKAPIGEEFCEIASRPWPANPSLPLHITLSEEEEPSAFICVSIPAKSLSSRIRSGGLFSRTSRWSIHLPPQRTLPPFRLGPIPPGDYEISFQQERGPRLVSVLTDLTPGEHRNITIRDCHAGRIRFTHKGNTVSLPFGSAALYREADALNYAADLDQFLPCGQYTLEYAAAGLAAWRQDINIEQGQTLTLELPATRGTHRAFRLRDHFDTKTETRSIALTGQYTIHAIRTDGLTLPPVAIRLEPNQTSGTLLGLTSGHWTIIAQRTDGRTGQEHFIVPQNEPHQEDVLVIDIF